MDFLEENVNDFDEFLEEQYDNLTIVSDADVNYYIGRIKKNKYMAKMFEDQAKNILKDYKEKVENWKNNKIDAINDDNERCLSLLKDYFDRTAKNKSSKLRFPEGSIGFYKTRQSIDIDEEEVIEYLLRIKDEYDFLNVDKYIENKPKLNTKLIRADGEVDSNNATFKLFKNPLPGVVVHPASEEFNVR